MCEFSNPGKPDTKKVVCKHTLPHSTATAAATLSCSLCVTVASNTPHKLCYRWLWKKPWRGAKKKKKKKKLDELAYTLIITLRDFSKHLGSPDLCNCFGYSNWYHFTPSSFFKFISTCPNALSCSNEFHRQGLRTNNSFHQDWIHHVLIWLPYY